MRQHRYVNRHREVFDAIVAARKAKVAARANLEMAEDAVQRAEAVPVGSDGRQPGVWHTPVQQCGGGNCPCAEATEARVYLPAWAEYRAAKAAVRAAVAAIIELPKGGSYCFLVTERVHNAAGQVQRVFWKHRHKIAVLLYDGFDATGAPVVIRTQAVDPKSAAAEIARKNFDRQLRAAA